MSVSALSAVICAALTVLYVAVVVIDPGRATAVGIGFLALMCGVTVYHDLRPHR